jgi:hypothetical protein
MLHNPNEFVLDEGSVITKVARRVTEVLEAGGVRVVCCGGAARDAYHFRTPKDFDFITLYDPKGHEPIDDVQAEMVEWALYKDTDFTDIAVMLSYDEGNLQLHWVVKAKYKGYSIDIISPRARCATPEDAVRALDVSLNAAWVDVDTPFVALCCTLPGVYPSVLDNFPVRLMAPFACTQDRIDYLRSKYPQYRYDINPAELISNDIGIL